MNIFNIKQIRSLDQHTIENEPIASIDLMERAAIQLSEWFLGYYPYTDQHFVVFSGKGNNGGDGLALARLLSQYHYEIDVYYIQGERYSSDFEINLERFAQLPHLEPIAIQQIDQIPAIDTDVVIIDALLGSGIQGAVKGIIKEVIDHINELPNQVIAIDVPSGLLADYPTTSSSVHADITLTLESPKLAFFYPENAKRVGAFEIIPIGLDEIAKEEMKTDHHYLSLKEISGLIKERGLYDHKGLFGHALLVNGSHGKIGAAILSSRACLRAGVGLLTVHVPRCGYSIIQSTIPECMVQTDIHERVVTGIPNVDLFNAIGIGPGIGTNPLSYKALKELFENYRRPMVIDADALNIISSHPALMELIPENSILTPHMKEFSRLFGETENDFEKNVLQRTKSNELGVYIILKGAHTAISCPDGQCYFNSTGNPGMATAGSGDTLTGILTALLSQGYSTKDASLIGVFVHGLAGDLAARHLGHESLIASDIIDHLGQAYKIIHNPENELKI